MTTKTVYDEEFEKIMRELRCTNCRAKLADEYVYKGRIAIKCYKCNVLNRFIFKDYRDMQNDKIKTVPQSGTNN